MIELDNDNSVFDKLKSIYWEKEVFEKKLLNSNVDLRKNKI